MTTTPNELTIRVTRWRWLSWLLLHPWWKRHTWTITAEGITERSGWISRKETKMRWERVQDRAINRGMFARMFGYGTIMLETAGERGGMTLRSVAHCKQAYALIGYHVDAMHTRSPGSPSGV